MKLQYKYTTLCLLLINSILFGQQNILNKANAKFNNLSYVEAISLYSNLVNDGYGTAEIFENLANAYYYQSNYELAKVSYDSLFTINKKVSAATYYKYISVLKNQQQSKAAEYWYAQLIDLYPKEKQQTNNKANFFGSSQKLSVEQLAVKNVHFNSNFSDYKVAYLGEDKIVFTSSRDTKKRFSKRTLWNNDAYTNLYQGALDDKDSLVSLTKLKGSINTYYNESSAVFTKNGTTMYFTSNNNFSGKVATDSLNNVLLKIYKATFNGKRWGNVEALPFNGNQYSCAHPALSADEDYLYFSSDMDGTKGASDLFRVAINGTAYGEPENLGDSINSVGRDTFPFVSSENILVFASDARKGLGGLDLYYVDLTSKSQKVYTFGAPVNSSSDDFGLVYKEAKQTGFFTSNRKAGGVGSDDIYQFKGLTIPKLKDVTILIKSKEEKPLIGVTKVKLTDNINTTVELPAIDQEITLFDLKASKKYQLEFLNDNYQALKTSVSHQVKDTIVVYLTEKEPVLTAIDLKEVVKLAPIYFDFDATQISQQSKLELEKVVLLMNKYPEINIDLIGHTDRRGAEEYNKELSLERAESTKKWLVKRGVSASRITTKGLGELKPISTCVGVKKCSKKQHNQNRRTEFMIR
ncbi:OmpA family protein [uncultured Polaribacter sp.]|uniref:OmpA family protein n=1 Tax=uncultured Polaribacter sp. TaxID=174711 RepID=UPI00260F319D|nr:OmpA family protein [uncultured Polaribacter sp.]